MKYIFLLLISLFTISCQSQKAMTTFETITFSRSPCRGFCPTYELTVQSNGQATLNGKRFYFSDKTKNQEAAVYNTTLDKETLSKINETAEDFKNAILKEEYKDTKTDVSGFRINVKYKDGSEKKVYVYGSYNIEVIKKFFTELDILRDNQNWKK